MDALGQESEGHIPTKGKERKIILNILNYYPCQKGFKHIAYSFKFSLLRLKFSILYLTLKTLSYFMPIIQNHLLSQIPP